MGGLHAAPLQGDCGHQRIYLEGSSEARGSTGILGTLLAISAAAFAMRTSSEPVLQAGLRDSHGVVWGGRVPYGF